MIVLLPETGAAVRSARGNRMQSDLHLALGSGLAQHRPDHSCGRGTVTLFSLPLAFGLPPLQIVLLTLIFSSP